VSSASYKRLARVPVVFDLSPLPFPSSAPMSKTTRARDATAADYIPMASGERSTPSDLIVDTEREYYYQSSRPNRPSWSFWIGPWLMHGLLIVVYMTILLPRSCKTADAATSSQTSKSGKVSMSPDLCAYGVGLKLDRDLQRRCTASTETRGLQEHNRIRWKTQPGN
jgi:hypothetical protein